MSAHVMRLLQHRFQRTWFFLPVLLSFLVFSVAPVGVAAEDSPTAVTIEIEAEDFERSTRLGELSWRKSTEIEGFSGTGYVAALPDEGENFGLGEGPRAEYRVEFPRAGTYYVWVLGYGFSNSNSLHLDLAGEERKEGVPGGAEEIELQNGRWRWRNENGEDARATLEVPAPGLQTVRLWVREDGVSVDRMAFSTRLDYHPEPVEDSGNRPVGPMPEVADGFVVELYAKEPLVRHPAGMCFDRRGRLFVGQGPQFRRPKPDTPGDSVRLLLDTDGDGIADSAKTFASGFNCIQSLVWRGDDLWVANSPELTIVRDKDGDDVADEYVLVYADLGNLEHGLHGLNWAPDGKLYMSKGNSKGHSDNPDRIAPKPFRDLWDVSSPPGAPDFPPPRTFTAETYAKTWHDPDDDWGRTGGVLRCDDLGRNLEIVSRGNRNPWDMSFDDGFNFLGTDNDQEGWDKIFMPFFGAHFGWGHPWSYSWEGVDHPPTVRASGPFYIGSGTGVSYYGASRFPEAYRNVFFISDWDRKNLYCYRPRWDGAQMQLDGELEVVARQVGSGLFAPTDIVSGPEGALYVGGWSRGYGVEWRTYNKEQDNEGRVFRFRHKDIPLARDEEWQLPKREKDLSEWTLVELVDDLTLECLPVWRVDAQNELVRRGLAVVDELMRYVDSGGLTKSQETWIAWAIGRTRGAVDGSRNPRISAYFAERTRAATGRRLNLRLQALRILAHRARRPSGAERLSEEAVAAVREALGDAEPRVRFEAVQTLWQAQERSLLDALVELVAGETDPVTYYSGWGALRDLGTVKMRRGLLRDSRPSLRFAALLGFLGTDELSEAELLAIIDTDTDERLQEWALRWLLVGAPKRVTEKEPEQRGLHDTRILLGRIRETRNTRMRSHLVRLLAQIRVEEDEDVDRLRDFYQELEEAKGPGRVEAQAAALRAAGTHNDALPFLWEALAAEAPLREAAIAAFEQLGERGRQFLWKRLQTSTPEAPRVAAIEALARTASEVGSDDVERSGVEVLATVYKAADDPRVRRNVLRLLLDPDWSAARTESESDVETANRDGQLGAAALTLAVDIGRQAATDPDPRVHQLVPQLARKLGVEIEVTAKREPVTAAHVRELLPAAQAKRGREIFFDRTRAACVSCHQVGDEGVAFAPPLSDIGRRATLEHIIESLLEPSAKITEGFRATTVITGDGRVLTGVVRQETNSAFEMFLPDGRAVEMLKSDVAGRKMTNTSIMPRIAELLAAEEVADLTQWLLTLKEALPAPGTPPKTAPGTPPTTTPGKSPATAQKKRAGPMAPIEDLPGLPRVLLIGDSISIGYTLGVRELLAGKANVHRPPTNCGPTTRGLAEIEDWLGTKPWDVIHFNWGLHDLKYLGPDGKNLADPNDSQNRPQVPIEAYEKNLRQLVARLKKTGAVLIWRTTTPVPEGAKGRVPGDAARYNAVAARIMQANAIAVDDQYTFAKPRLAEIQKRANVHFHPEGSRALAGQAALAIEAALKRRQGDG